VIDAPPREPSSPDDGDQAFLPDPYQVVPPPPPPKPRATLSTLALSSVLAALLLGPVGAILAILFGWYARREIEDAGGRRSGHALATVGIALGVVLTPAWGFAMSYIAWTQTYRSDPGTAAAPSHPSEPPADDPPAPASPPRSGPPTALPPHLLAAPARTRTEREGRIAVIDLGRATSSLADELARQRAEAKEANQTMVVMTTLGRCDPCRGVDHALKDPLMQTALAQVRLVRIDTEIFAEDLEALRIPSERVPGFYLLSLDLSPRDGIDGGEWDADIAQNIAPVLGAFVRGKYTERRERWRPVPGTGIAL
jgi:hypothetical protein